MIDYDLMCLNQSGDLLIFFRVNPGEDNLKVLQVLGLPCPYAAVKG